MSVKKNLTLINLIYFIIFFANAFFYSFLQIYLISKGFSESNIGIISSLTPFLCLLVNPIYNLIGSTNKRIKYLFLFLSIMEAVVFILVYSVNTFTLLILAMCLVSIIDPPLFVIMDAYTSSFAYENNKSYSYIRLFGCFSYALATLTGGFLIKLTNSYFLIFYLAAFLMIISSILIKFLNINKKEINKEQNRFLPLFKNKEFLALLIYFVIILAFGSVGDTYISVYLTNEKHLDTSTYGVISSLWFFIEILTIVILNKIKCHKDGLLLILMAFGYMGRIIAISLNLQLGFIVLFALFRGVGMGINLYLYVPRLTKIVSQENISSSLLLVSIFKSILSTILLATSGYLIETFGYNLIFMIYSIFVLIFMIIYFVFNRNLLKKAL